MSIDVYSFTGGWTDSPIGSKDQFVLADNLLLSKQGTLFMRPGSTFFDSTYPQLPTGIGEPVKTLINFNNSEELFAVGGTNLYRYTSSGWTEVTGPTGNHAFQYSVSTSKFSHMEWRGHLFITDDSGTYTVKVYKDSGGTWRVVTAGLPEFPATVGYTSATELATQLLVANDLRTNLLTHFASTSAHVSADATSAALITAPAATTEATLYVLISQLLSAYALHYKDSAITPGVYHKSYYNSDQTATTPRVYATRQLLTNQVTPTTLTESNATLRDLHLCFYNHHDDLDTHADTVGLPTYANLTPVYDGPTFEFTLQPLYDFVNTLKTRFNAHISSSTTTEYSGTMTNGSNVITAIASTAAMNVGDWVQCTVYGTTNNATVVINTYIFSKTANTITLYSADTGAASNITGTGTYVAGATGTFVVCGSATNLAHTVISLNGTYRDYYITTANATSALTLASLLDAERRMLVGHVKNLAATGYAVAESKKPHWNQAVNAGDLILDWPDMQVTAAGFGGAYYNIGYLAGTFDEVNPPDVPAMLAAANELRTVYNAHVGRTDRHNLFNNYITESGATFNYHTAGQIRTGHEIGANPPVLATYGYAFVYYRSYTVGAQTFEDWGTPLLTSAENVWSIETRSMAISTIPVLTNTGLQNYDTSAMKVKIYRTTAGGTVYYYVGEVTNGTTTFTDTVTDAALVLNTTLYTTDGSVNNDPPPYAKYLHTVGNYGYYGHITDGSEYLPNRVRQSINDDLDSCPQDFYVDLPSAVAGVSSAREVPIAWTATGTYRLEGAYDSQGRGALTAVPIAENIGLAGSYSPVKIEEGVVFAGSDGFYFTDGLTLVKLSTSINTNYKNLIRSSLSAKSIQGAYDRLPRRVWWTVSKDSESGANDYCVILEIDKGLTQAACFVTATAAAPNWFPSSLTFFNDQLVRGHASGYVFKHEAGLTSDYVVNTALATTSWHKTAVVWDYVSTGFDGDAPKDTKYATKISPKFYNDGNCSVQINTINDLGTQFDACTPILFRGNLVWGDPTIVWGDETIRWGASGEVREKRHFPAGSFRFRHKQIQFTNASVVVASSDGYEPAALNSGALTLTMPNLTWPGEMVGLYVYLSHDNYQAGFEIASYSGGVLTFLDPNGVVPATATYRWVVRGVPRNEAFHLMGFTINTGSTGESPDDASGDSGANR